MLEFRACENMRMPGVEPRSQAWEACMMPLHYMRSGDSELLRDQWARAAHLVGRLVAQKRAAPFGP